MTRAASRLFLVAGAAGVAAYGLSDSVVVETVVALGLALAALLATIRRAAGPNAAPRAWALLAGGAGLWFLGWAPWQLAVLETGQGPASFSLADALFLGSSVLLAAGLLGLVRSGEPGRGAGIETALLTIMLALLSWTLLLAPAFERGDLAGAAGATQALYALMDVVLVAAVGRAFLGSARNHASRLLLASTVALVVANTLWNEASLAGAYAAGGYADLGWLVSSVLVGAAALHPAAADAGRPDASTRWLIHRRLAVLLMAGFTLPAFAVGELVFGVEVDTLPIVLGSTLLATFVLLRAAKLLLESDGLRRDLARQNEELKELDRLKDDFVASVSHELRTPLTSIRGYLELVLEREAGELTDEQESFLGVVDRNAERLLRVVGDLLFVAQINAGSLPLAEGRVDPRELVVQAADSARPTAAERGIDLSLELGELPPSLRGDPSRLAQALDNLVSNAIKFTPGGGRVELRARADGSAVELAVADSGPGIAPADQVRLFDRFFRTASASAGAVPGTGLGLAITKAIVEAHGGTIDVESELGAGTEVRIVLPAAA